MQSTAGFDRDFSSQGVEVVTFFRYWAPVCGLAGLIFYFSSQSHPDQYLPSFIDVFNDKVLHAVEYALLGGLSYRAFHLGTNKSWRHWAVPLAILLAALYGISDEVHQAFVPFRDPSWHDWLADTIGATIGAVVVCRMLNLYLEHSVREVTHQR
jgi:VanZ family protein